VVRTRGRKGDEETRERGAGGELLRLGANSGFNAFKRKNASP